MKQRLFALFLCAAALLSLFPALTVRASEDNGQEATLLSTKKSIVSYTGFSDVSFIHDDELTKSIASKGNASLTLENSAGIGSLYFIYQFPYEAGYTVTDNATGKSFVAGKQGFLHEYLDLQAKFGTAPTSVTVTYDQGKVYICELMLYSSGKVPDTVQQWKAPAENQTDLLLFSTHGDDEQLFFAGVLPYYAKALGYNVQVVYLTDHRNNSNTRVHEMLNGMWAVGCDIYPVFGSFPDFLKETLNATYAEFKSYGFTRNDILEYCTEQIRRFKPKVIVTHDFNGEYKHGQHMVYADCVSAALELAANPAKFPGSAELYGTWDVPKAYFHLYWENIIVMDWDTPMEELDGMTPFEVTQKLGFPCHKSQQWTWFKGWINGKNGVVITRADQIATHSPCLYGLYRSTVGPDVEKKDFFENVTTHAQDNAQWLKDNPQTTAPRETTPAETTPENTTTEDGQGQIPTPPGNTGSEKENRIWILWLAVFGLVVVLIALIFILHIGHRPPTTTRRNRHGREK